MPTCGIPRITTHDHNSYTFEKYTPFLSEIVTVRPIGHVIHMPKLKCDELENLNLRIIGHDVTRLEIVLVET